MDERLKHPTSAAPRQKSLSANLIKHCLFKVCSTIVTKSTFYSYRMMGGFIEVLLGNSKSKNNGQMYSYYSF